MITGYLLIALAWAVLPLTIGCSRLLRYLLAMAAEQSGGRVEAIDGVAAVVAAGLAWCLGIAYLSFGAAAVLGYDVSAWAGPEGAL